MKRYLLSKAAQDDLQELKDYTQLTWGNAQTRQYFSEIRMCLESLVIDPGLGISRNEVSEGLRGIGIGRHVIFYRMSQTGIEIARILHGRVDVMNHFAVK